MSAGNERGESSSGNQARGIKPAEPASRGSPPPLPRATARRRAHTWPYADHPKKSGHGVPPWGGESSSGNQRGESAPRGPPPLARATAGRRAHTWPFADHPKSGHGVPPWGGESRAGNRARGISAARSSASCACHGGTPCPRVIMTTYDPVSENLAATEPGTGGEAEGNCVAARRGGKQPEAKEQSQRQLNSIRCEFAASLRGTGEACEKSNPSLRHRPANARDGANWHGWSENAPKEVCVSGESCADRHRARSARTVQQSEPPYERGSPVTRMEQREAGK
jgi:hypothetical protein